MKTIPLNRENTENISAKPGRAKAMRVGHDDRGSIPPRSFMSSHGDLNQSTRKQDTKNLQ
jgi:hypothetical protein